jgi:hypothetical protein
LRHTPGCTLDDNTTLSAAAKLYYPYLALEKIARWTTFQTPKPGVKIFLLKFSGDFQLWKASQNVLSSSSVVRTGTGLVSKSLTLAGLFPWFAVGWKTI